ncbi:MAG: cell division protein CrgA [Promicromonosporaceae bacterium]|nr:cell division protein CrgA [Promicromonosporaceae bacterium]
MPESKSRKKKTNTAVDPAFAARQAKASEAADKPTPQWLVPTMLALMVIGLIWIVVYYLTSSRVGGGFPIPPIRAWNLAIGFALIIAGFGLTTRWK